MVYRVILKVYCGVLWYTVVYCGILWCTVVYYGILKVYYGVLWYTESILWCTMVYKHSYSVWFALQSHTGEVFVLEAHPTDPRILMSAGALCYDGCFSRKESSVIMCVSCRA